MYKLRKPCQIQSPKELLFYLSKVSINTLTSHQPPLIYFLHFSPLNLNLVFNAPLSPPLHFSLSATPTVVQGGHHLNRCRAWRQLTPFMPYKLVTQSIYAIQILAHKYRHLVWCLWFKWTECSRNFRLAKPVSDVSMTNIKMIHINIGSYLQFLFTVLF